MGITGWATVRVSLAFSSLCDVPLWFIAYIPRFVQIRSGLGIIAKTAPKVTAISALLL